MHNEIIELNDSDSDHARPVKQESNDTPHLNLEVTALKASLTAKTKLVAEQGKDSELTKLRKKNKQLKNEQPNGTVVEATGHQDVDQDMSDNIASNLLMP
jgi:phage terminase Nu1 subunit (DNA packaging protein)